MGEMMAEEILVPTKGLNGIEEIIPHLEHIANPAMSVILLVPYRTELLRSLLHQWIPAEVEGGRFTTGYRDHGRALTGATKQVG